MKRKAGQLVINKKAGHNFEILEELTAGISLFGLEVKSLKALQGSFADSFVGIDKGEAYLKGFYLPPFQKKNSPSGYNEYRPRKLLLQKKELKRLEKENQKKGITIIPLVFELTDNGLIKLKIAVASGLSKFDKREKMKQKDEKRNMDRIMKKINQGGS